MFALDEPGAVAIAALCITTPTLAFIFTFSTIAYGVGVAFLTLALSVNAAARYSLRGVLLACFLGAFSIGVYQPFVFGIAILAAVNALHRSQDCPFSALRRNGYWLVYLAGSVLIYFLANLLAIQLRSVDPQYVGQFVDIAGLFQQPRERLEILGQATGRRRAIASPPVRPELDLAWRDNHSCRRACPSESVAAKR